MMYRIVLKTIENTITVLRMAGRPCIGCHSMSCSTKVPKFYYNSRVNLRAFEGEFEDEFKDSTERNFM